MAYEMVMPYHLHMPSYFLETFTEYPKITEGYSVNPIKLANLFILKALRISWLFYIFS